MSAPTGLFAKTVLGSYHQCEQLLAQLLLRAVCEDRTRVSRLEVWGTATIPIPHCKILFLQVLLRATYGI